ncbi:MAG: dihydroneopterin aldolase [Candidatus Krumholzibacteriia bacterium]
MDRISLHGIDVYAHHGVHPAERELGQRFVIDVDLWADCEGAAAGDDLAQAVDYTAVHRCVRAAAADVRCHLIEAVADRVCLALLAGFAVTRVAVTVHKPNPPIPNFLGKASVTLTRDQAWLAGRGGGRP